MGIKCVVCSWETQQERVCFGAGNQCVISLCRSCLIHFTCPCCFCDQLEMTQYTSCMLNQMVLDSGCGLTHAQSFFYQGCFPPSCGKTLEFTRQDRSSFS